MTNLKEYFVILPDCPDVMHKRLELRERHFAKIKADVDAGIITFGGGLLEEHGDGEEPPKVKGSIMTIMAESAEAVWERIRNDEFAIAGVWNLERVEIHPFKCAIRLPM